MKTLFYPRLAWDGLKKNRRLAWPYLLTCVCMAGMFYILSFLASPEAIALLPRGKSSVSLTLNLGKYVILLFSLIFLFYTYSFLLRRRAGEFGLYNVLGMGKRSLVRIISWESAILLACSLAGGLLLGILLSKLAELGLMNLLDGTIDYSLRLDPASVGLTVLCYTAIFFLIWLAAVIRVSRGSAVSLMKADKAGEKPPRGNLFLALLGAALLAAAYWLATSIENPLAALIWFFAAVLMVILATYLLMISGSVRLCRFLQRRKGYYYKAKHFVSVSSMAYRMKRNGAGLASICVIATMVLVMLSSTTCMWFGAGDALLASYPREMNVTMYLEQPENLEGAGLDPVIEAVSAFVEEKGGKVSNALEGRMIVLNGLMKDGFVQCDYETGGGIGLGGLTEIDLVAAEGLTAADGSPLELAADEAVLIPEGVRCPEDRITLAMGDVSRSWRVVSVLKDSADASAAGAAALSATPRVTMAVADPSAAVEGFERTDAEGNRKVRITWEYDFDTGLSDEENSEIDYHLEGEIAKFFPAASGVKGIRAVWVDSRADGAADFYGMYGSFFFIGILLSAVFLLAAVLIIYYKQISEGYEDAKRFDIMRKVGMTKREIRSSISSQLLTVFALPLAFAGLHLLFAFPMIRRVLTLFSLNNVGLFIRTTLISFAAFAAFYAVVYRLTSGVYYRIVSRAET